MIGVSSVTGGHQAGEQGEAAWAAGWRSDVGVVESHALGGKKIHGGRPHVLRSVNGSVQATKVEGGPGWAFRNSGVMVHGQTPESMAKGQDFPNSIEVQLLGGKGDGKRTTANLCTPGTDVVMNKKLLKRHCISSKSKTYHGDQWVTVEIEVRGSKSIKHVIDGETVLEYTKPQLDDGTLLEGGTISLQSESHPVEFRKVELKKLKK